MLEEDLRTIVKLINDRVNKFLKDRDLHQKERSRKKEEEEREKEHAEFKKELDRRKEAKVGGGYW